MSLSDDEDDFLSADEDCLTAPPPTPALSSSFASDEQSKWSNASLASPKPRLISSVPTQSEEDESPIVEMSSQVGEETKSKLPAAKASSTTLQAPISLTASQYRWRIPAKNNSKTNVASEQTTSSPSNTLASSVSVSASGEENRILPANPSNEATAETKTRLALDRLSQKLSQHDKNLFQKITDDIKKVSIKQNVEGEPSVSSLSSDQEVAQASIPGLPSFPNIPIVSDLGSTIGCWGWTGATKLLASASQVTSQVGSALDSVINPDNPANLLSSALNVGSGGIAPAAGNNPPPTAIAEAKRQE